MFNYQSYLQSQIDILKEEGRYRYFLEVNKSAQHFPQFQYSNKEGLVYTAVNWCSNDYLGMSTNKQVIAELELITHKSGTGSSGTRNISGTTNYHNTLETTIANWYKKESALLFNGAFAANVTTLQTLGKNIPGLVFISDERNHASIIEGIKGCKNEKKVFKHNDTVHLEQLLATIPEWQPKLIVFESVYSMSGTIAPVKEIVALAKKYNSLTYIDEVHGVGLYGEMGAGVLEQENLQADVDIINGTLSKSIGVFGGFITANATIIDFIRSFGSGFIFTTSLPPAICAAANLSIQIIQQSQALRKYFFENVAHLRDSLKKASINFTTNKSHITIIPIAGAARCRIVANKLLELYGIYLQPINYPTVPVGEECLRLVITASHKPEHIIHLADSLNKVINGNNQAYRAGFKTVAVATVESEA